VTNTVHLASLLLLYCMWASNKLMRFVTQEAVHRAKMDPNHEGYDAQYRSDFQSAASRAYADNMARRQAAWAYRNSEMRRLTQAANLEYPGDVIPTAPPVNLDDLYEDNELRDEDEGGEVSTVPLTLSTPLLSNPITWIGLATLGKNCCEPQVCSLDLH
jgi:hypothetical protein